MNKSKFTLLNCFIVFEILLLVLSLIFIVRIKATDELWNYQNINKLYNHFQIYKDTNNITTPLFFYFGYLLIILSFSNYYFVYRIYGLIIFALIFYLIFIIAKKLKMNMNLIHVYLSLLLLVLFQIITTSANYNYLAILFYLIGLYLYISNSSSNLKQAILFLCIFFTKQNIGIYYLICILVTELYTNKGLKKYFWDQLTKIIFIVVPCVLFYGLYNYLGIWNSFIDYCFGGISEFSSKNIAFSAEPFTYVVPLSFILLTIFINATRKKYFSSVDETFFSNLNVILIFLVTLLLITYPIFNSSHFMMTFPVAILGLFYIFDKLLLSELFIEQKYSTYSKILCVIILLIVIARIGFYYKTGINDSITIMDCNSHYYLLSMDKKLYEVRNELGKYIQEENKKGNDVIIVSYESAIVMVELNQSHGLYDLLFKGNIGSNTVSDIEEDIISRKNTKFLVVNDESLLFEQEFPEIWSFIKTNLEYQGDIGYYSIYENK